MTSPASAVRFPAVLLVFVLLLLPYAGQAATGTGQEQQHLDSTVPCSTKSCLLERENPGSSAFRESWKEHDDPSRDGWQTEVFNNLAGKQLKKLGKIILHPETAGSSSADLIDEKFTAAELYPQNLKTVFKGGDFSIKRPAQQKTKQLFQGSKGFSQMVEQLAEPFRNSSDLRYKFKLYRVEKKENIVVTHQYFALSWLTKQGMVEQNADWQISWLDRGEKPPLIVHIAVNNFEEVTGHSTAGKKLLADAAPAVLAQNSSYSRQLLQGYQDFLGAFENTQEFSIFGAMGMAVADVNNDGLDDLYLCQEQGLPNLLYIQQQDGTAVDYSARAGVNWLESSRSALFLDVDNDGDQDLIVTMPGGLVLSENDGTGTFSLQAILPIGEDPMSLAAADFDLDGDLDIYVTLYNPDRYLEKKKQQKKQTGMKTFVYHNANNGPANILFRNDILRGSRWLFTDVTAGSGLDVNNNRFSLGASWEDYDNDGDQDLYVANDYGRDNLYRNDTVRGGKARFTDVSTAATIENGAGSMSISWGDYNRDGQMDAFLSAMWSSAGNRITYQESFKPENKKVKSRLQKFARGNTLLRNRGDGSFADEGHAAGVEMGRWAWSSSFVDLNNDGWQDLVVANGFLTGDKKGGDL